MVRLLRYLIAIPVLSGCSLITEPPSELNRVCTDVGYTSQLTVSFQSATVLPEYFSAMVNGVVVVDECQIGSPNRYVFRRHNDFNATLTLFAWPDSPFSTTFFNAQGVPYDLGEASVIDAVILGRPACDADPIDISHVQKPLAWTEVYANGSNCAIDGYLGN